MKVYKSPNDLPLWNWIKINETGSSVYIYINSNYDKLVESKKSIKAFEYLYSVFFEKYVLNKEYLQYLEAKKRLALKIADAYSSEDRSGITFAEIEAQEFEAKYEKEGDKKDFNTLIAILEKEIGFKINRKEMTLSEFYEHINLFVENQRQMQKHMLGWQKR